MPDSSLHSRARLARTRASKLSKLATRPSLWSPLRAGVAASVEHLSVPLRSDVRTVLDVGASRGQFALHAAYRFPDATILCFEPLPQSREALNKVLGERVRVYPTAVGAEAGTAQINVSAQDDSSSLLPIGARQVAEFPGTGPETTLDVNVITIDSVVTDDLAGPILLKIDVQGFELDVLRGATNVLERIDEIFVECSFVELYEGQALADEVVAFLLPHGLRLVGLYGISYASDGGALQADLLFRRT